MACMAAVAFAEGAEVPDWVHLVPTAHGAIATVDGRGPYYVQDAEAIIAASFAADQRLQIDENHAQDLAAPMGGASPARGWIAEMQVRADGIWGRVEWNAAGRAMVADRAYRAMSPVILADKAKRITRILRASLVNRPNFRGLATLNQETEMFDLKKLALALGLAEDAGEDEILAAIAKLKAPEVAAQSAITEIATVLGVTGGDAKAVLAAARVAKAGTGDMVALQAEVTTLKGDLASMHQAAARAASEAFVDAAFREGRAGVRQDNREELVSLHMEQPETVKRLIEGMPRLDMSRTKIEPPPPANGEIALNAEQSQAAKILGVDPDAYRKTLAAERMKETI